MRSTRNKTLQRSTLQENEKKETLALLNRLAQESPLSSTPVPKLYDLMQKPTEETTQRLTWLLKSSAGLVPWDSRIGIISNTDQVLMPTWMHPLPFAGNILGSSMKRTVRTIIAQETTHFDSGEEVISTDVDSGQEVISTDVDSGQEVISTDVDSGEDVITADVESGEDVIIVSDENINVTNKNMANYFLTPVASAADEANLHVPASDQMQSRSMGTDHDECVIDANADVESVDKQHNEKTGESHQRRKRIRTESTSEPIKRGEMILRSAMKRAFHAVPTTALMPQNSLQTIMNDDVTQNRMQPSVYSINRVGRFPNLMRAAMLGDMEQARTMLPRTDKV